MSIRTNTNTPRKNNKNTQKFFQDEIMNKFNEELFQIFLFLEFQYR